MYKLNINIGTDTFDRPRTILGQVPPQTSLQLKVMGNRRLQTFSGSLDKEIQLFLFFVLFGSLFCSLKIKGYDVTDDKI